MYSKEFLKNKTAKELAQIQNGKSDGVYSKHGKSTIRSKLQAIKKGKGATNKKATKKENEQVLHKCSDSVLELLHALSKPTSEVGTAAKGQTADMAKKLIAVLQLADKSKPNNCKPKAKAKVQESDSDSDDEEESDESDEE
eukprot:5931996-Prymnesium_polylepis.1